jgi:hypothetical protein
MWQEDVFFDIACQRWIHVAIPLKADAILLDMTRFCHRRATRSESAAHMLFPTI